jgi:hypothetical protein
MDDSVKVDVKYLTMANDRYAWPGGYELFFVCDDSGVLCAPCVVNEWEEVIRDAYHGDGWFIEGWSHTGQNDGPVQCDHCYYVIIEEDKPNGQNGVQNE